MLQFTTIRLMAMAKDEKIHSNFLGAAYWAIKNVLKKYKPTAGIVEMDERIPSDSDVEKICESKEIIETLKEEAGKLSKNEQIILFKHYVLGMKLVKIAEQMGIKPDTLRAQHKRIVDKLRNELTVILIET